MDNSELESKYNELAKYVVSLIKEADAYIKSPKFANFELMEWEQISIKENFYYSYGKEVERKAILVDYNSKLIRMEINLKSVRKSLITSSLPPSMISSYKKGVDDLLEKINDYRGIILGQIDKQNSVIRFLNSVQYMTGFSSYSE